MDARQADARNMADDYQTLKEKAARAGMSLPDYLLSEMKKSEPLVSAEELWQRIRSRTPIRGVSGVELVRKGREEREQQIEERIDRIGSRR
jgi:hypothetical protein